MKYTDPKTRKKDAMLGTQKDVLQRSPTVGQVAKRRLGIAGPKHHVKAWLKALTH